MNSKKFLSAVLAGAMALSLAVPVMAADASGTTDSTGNQSYKVDADVMAATIKVQVPTDLTGTVKLNPYQLPYTDSMGEVHKDDIFSPAQYMVNYSNVAIGVTAAVKAEAKGEVVLLDSKTDYEEAMEAAETKGAKNVYMYLEMAKADDEESLPTWEEYYKADKHLAVVGIGTAENGMQKKNIATMEAATYTESTNEDGQTTTTETPAANGGRIGLHFAGAVNDQTDKVWGSADKVSLSITFTFTPLRTTEGVTAGADEAVAG